MKHLVRNLVYSLLALGLIACEGNPESTGTPGVLISSNNVCKVSQITAVGYTLSDRLRGLEAVCDSSSIATGALADSSEITNWAVDCNISDIYAKESQLATHLGQDKVNEIISSGDIVPGADHNSVNSRRFMVYDNGSELVGIWTLNRLFEVLPVTMTNLKDMIWRFETQRKPYEYCNEYSFFEMKPDNYAMFSIESCDYSNVLGRKVIHIADVYFSPNGKIKIEEIGVKHGDVSCE